MVARVGGSRNGFTSNDYTAYYETLPVGQFDLALRLEADRMCNAHFRAEAVEAERTIILSERAGRENSSAYRLREQLLGAVFPSHGYGHPIIGYNDDLQRITRDELWQHYRTFYGPDNAVAVAAGDFDSASLLARLDERFGAIPARFDTSSQDRVEPPQSDHRRLLVTGHEPTAYVQILFRAVEAIHPDFFPLVVLDSILGGAKGMGFRGGGGGNRTSRIYGALVNADLAAGAGSDIRPTVDPFVFGIGATVRRGVEPQRVEDAIWAEVDRLVEAPVDAAELARARKQTLAQFAYGTESVSSQGYWLGFSEIVASLGWFLDYPAHVAVVTATDVQRVAATYLRRERATVGWYVREA